MSIELTVHEYSPAALNEAAIDAVIHNEQRLIEDVLNKEAYASGPLGWFDPSRAQGSLASIKEVVTALKSLADLLIVIGVGGSNRGAKASLEALDSKQGDVFFAGDTLSATQLKKAVELVHTRSVALCIIAKDFNTIEPGITFRVLRSVLEERYGSQSSERIVAIGSYGPDQLYELARCHHWHFLEFPADINGRYSVLNNVGLFPMAWAGVDIDKLLAGAIEEHRSIMTCKVERNTAVRYAVGRNLLAKANLPIEALVIFEPSLEGFARWWVQLFGESEGKTANALFPTYFSYSEDLHAIGQYVQEGPRRIVETFLNFTHSKAPITIEPSKVVADRFDYLDHTQWDFLNETVYTAARDAHLRDTRPVFELVSSEPIAEKSLGGFFYFFLFSVYLSATLLGVDPFSQNGVEGYKKNLYHHLGKEGVWQN